MWAKNLMFWAVCAAGVLTLAAAILPSSDTPSGIRSVETKVDSDSFRSVVEQVNTAFRGAWQARGITPAPRADQLTVARRLSLGVTGTIPSLEEVRLIEAHQQTNTTAWWLDRLLADRRSAEYLAERWARVFVGVEDGPFLRYRRRRFAAWLSDQLFANRPYDELVRELIAAEGVWTDSPAANYVTATLDSNNDDRPDPDKLAGRTVRAFLGVRLDCVRCHDDFLGGDWLQKDYQGIAAYYARTRTGWTGIRDVDEGEYETDDEKPQPVEPCIPFQKDLSIEGGTRREQLAQWVTHRENRAFARTAVNRSWATLFGRPLVEPIDSIPLDDEVPAALDLLADDFVANGFDFRRLLHLIAATEVFHLDSRAAEGTQLSQKHDEHWAAFPVRRLRPEQVIGSLVQAASLKTLDHESHILIRTIRAGNKNEFIKRYGDMGEDEFDDRGGTIPQRLLMMNGKIVSELIKHNPVFGTASGRILMLSPNDPTTIETAYLAVLTRRPSKEESAHFGARFADPPADNRSYQMEDMFWSLINSTEFSWNH